MFFSISLPAQEINALKRKIQSAEAEEKSIILNNLAQLTMPDSLEESLFYSQQAGMEALQQNIPFEEARSYYLQGMANASLGRKDFATFYLKKSVDLSHENSFDSLEVSGLLELARYYEDISLDTSIHYCEKAIDRSEVSGRKNLQQDALSYTGVVYYHKGYYDKALEYWERSLALSLELEDVVSEAELYNNIGVIYRSKGDNQAALSYFQKNLEIQEVLVDTLQMARSVSNIGNIYYYMDIDLQKAMQYYNRGLKLFESIGDLKSVAYLYNSIGCIEQKNEEFISAIESFEKGKEIFTRLKDDYGIAYTQNNLGSVYLEEGKYQQALKVSSEALKLFQTLGDQKTVASIYTDIAEAYHRSDQYAMSLSNYQKASKLYEELQTPSELYEVYKSISSVYESTGNTVEAFNFYKKYSELKDNVISKDYLEQVSDLETKYEAEKNRRALIEEKAIVQSQKAELLRKNIAIKGIAAGLVLVLVFSALLFSQYRQKRRANLLLNKQNLEIKNQHDQIKIQKKEITDSIEYASRIQNGLLPSERLLKSHLKDFFIYYRPRDIVSGDFYWYAKVGEKIVIIAADCTGHGVPGAFMSILSISYLNEVVSKDRITKPSDILETLRNYIICTLNQELRDGEELKTYDGIDMSVVTYTPSRKKLEFAGAYNPLYLIRHKQLFEYKADRMPVGLYSSESTTFNSQQIEIKDDDQIYLFSDGIPDQFGGPNNKKFMVRKFKNLLVKNADKSLLAQKEAIHKTISEWQNDTEQIDDILVMGIKF
jgi:serine phosphatase RsbU (regulator of sigma subunit)